jgi:DNA-binding response OmpR family regulator
MAPIFVIHAELDTRTAICQMLEYDGYVVYEAADLQTALTVPQIYLEHGVVLFEQDGRSLTKQDVLSGLEANPRLLKWHRYVCLTTAPDRLTLPVRNLLVVMGIPVVAEPFDMDELLAAVAQATERLKKPTLQELVSAWDAGGALVPSAS